MLNSERLEEAWFLYEAVKVLAASGKLQRVDFGPRDEKSCRQVMEDICYEAFQVAQESLRSCWIHHSCLKKGCVERMIVVDGLMKVRRAKCAVKGETVKMSGETPNTVQCCPLSPIRGNQHLSGSKFCEHHARDADASVEFQPPQMLGSTVAKATCGDMPKNEDPSLLVGCRKVKNVEKFYETTAGIIAAVRPCGVVVNFSELFTCESPSQVYLFLLFTFGRSALDFAQLKFVGYDRACDLEPFLRGMAKKGSDGATLLLEQAKFFVDRFHVKGHTEPVCTAGDPQCKYHPDLPCFTDVSGANTECAEQTFAWLGKFKKVTRQMSMWRFNFFLNF